MQSGMSGRVDIFLDLRMLITWRGEEKEGSSLTQHSQGIPCQSEHGLLAECSVRDASLTDDAGPSDISPGWERGDKSVRHHRLLKRKRVKSTEKHP